ncbi:histamine N-methyltransferase-like [Antennarius striatus]|uniref:histamine N-methyltransferase-like n=1 Tax=Antennarius striatus TaxID=241820 RepID=UPI0035B333C5
MPVMISPLRSLLTDDSRYQKGYQLFLDRSTEIQRMQDFINNQLPDIMSSTINGKSNLNVIGVGSGSGELDLKMFSALHLKNPKMRVDTEVVEPSPQQLSEYADLVSQTPDLDYISFNWNEMTAEEFEAHWKQKKMTKKADFIHMLQMMYYVKDPGATINFFHSILNKNGKLFISLLTGDSGWAKLDKAYGKRFRESGMASVFMDDVKRHLDATGLSYQSYLLPSKIDITECFTDGNEDGELMLEFLTEVLNFSQVCAPELKADVMELLRHGCSEQSDGKVLLNSNYEMVVIDQLPQI